MQSAVKSKILYLFKSSSSRSGKISKNIILSFVIKGLSIPVSLILVPMTINFVNPIQYGVWLTLSSIIGWMSFFDIGLGNGLRNKIAHSLALNQESEIKKYVSTTYAALTGISLILFICVYIASGYINWGKTLNIPASLSDEIKPVIRIIAACFCFQFIFQLINTIFVSTHQPSKASFISFLGQLLILISLYFVTQNQNHGSLNTLVYILAGLPVLVMLVASIFFYASSLKSFSPSFKFIHRTYIKGLLNIGGKFFIIQIGAMILFQTDNIIISRILGPESVTVFNVGYKLFYVLYMVFSVIITPYWSAFTDAYAKHDFAWIKQSLRKMKMLWLLLSIISVLVFVISQPIYKFWVGNKVIVPMMLSLSMAIYIISYVWQTLHVYFLNGVGKITLQLYLVVFSAIINIPLSIYLAKSFGLPGVISANTIVFIIMGIIFSRQTSKILNQTATGIWNK